MTTNTNSTSVRIDIRPSVVRGYTEIIKITPWSIEVLGNRRTVAEARERAQELREELFVK